MNTTEELFDGITITKKGMFVYKWRSDKRVILQAESLISWLGASVYIEDDVTFADFFNLVMKEHSKISEVFKYHLGGWTLSEWHDEWVAEPINDDDASHEQIDWLEVYWAVEIDTYNKTNDLDEYTGFHGVGRWKDDDDVWRDTKFSFSMTPLNKMKNYLFKINADWKIFNPDAADGKNHEQLTDDDWYIFTSKKSMTLYDVIGAILIDISFYGMPRDRNEKRVELGRRAEEVQNIDADDLISSEDFFAKLNEEKT